MNPATVLGAVLTVMGLGGYILGLSLAYPGRAFSITLAMVGITLIAVKSVFEDREVAGS